MEEMDFGENIDMGVWALARDIMTDVRLLYDLYFDYVCQHQGDEIPYRMPDNFIFISAFACIFDDLEVKAGYVPFVVTTSPHKLLACLVPHRWLVWRHKFIIDLVPVDGKFGVSVPQLVVDNDARKRFLQVLGLYPAEWGAKEKTTFDQGVSDLVEILEILMKKVPL